MISALKLGTKIISTNLGFFNPYELNFAITYRCNSKCKTCGIWKVKPKNEINLDEIKKFAKKIRFIHWIRLTGGEPFLRPDYVDIVRVLNDNLDLFLLSTPTNGTIPNLIYNNVKEILKFFHKRYIISISLDGPKKIHNKIRGVKCWEAVIETYKKLSELENKNFKVFFGYTISPYNVGYLKETVNDVKEVLPKVSLKDFHINIFQTSEIYYHNTQRKIKKDYIKKAIEEIELCIDSRSDFLDPINIIELKYLRLARKYLKTNRIPINCNIFNLSCFVDPMGNVYPCTIFNKKLGNLRENDYDLKRILCSKKAEATMKEIIKGNCPQCWTPCEAHQMILSKWFKI